MCPALLSVCSWGGPELGKELRVFTGNTGSWRLCSWAPGARGVVVTGHSCGTPSPLAPLAASSPPLLPCECGPARQPVLLVAGRGDLPSCHVGGDSSSGHRLCHAAIPYPVPEGSSSWRVWSNLPCLQLLLCPSREHAPARGTQQHLFPHPVVVLWERLKLLSKNLERAFTSIFCLQQTCDLQCVVIGENKAS